METLSLTVKGVEDAERFCEEFKQRFEKETQHLSDDLDGFLDDYSEEDDCCCIEEHEFYPLFIDCILPEEKMKDFIKEFAKTTEVFELEYTWESDNSSEGRIVEYKKDNNTLSIKDYYSNQGLDIGFCTHCDEVIDEVTIKEYDPNKKIICPHCNKEIEYDVDYYEEIIEL